jgi:hypothetical protein
MAHDDVQQSLRRGDKAEAIAKTAMYAAMYPGFREASENLAAVEAARLQGEAKREQQQDPLAMAVRNSQLLSQMPAGAARYSAMQMDSANRLPQGSDPKAAADSLLVQYQPIMREYASRLSQLTPEETLEVQQVLRSMPYSRVPAYLGVPDTRQLQDWWKSVIGPVAGRGNASWAQWGDSWHPVIGNAIRNTTRWDD